MNCVDMIVLFQSRRGKTMPMFRKSFCKKQHESVRWRVKLDRMHFARFEPLANECDSNL